MKIKKNIVIVETKDEMNIVIYLITLTKLYSHGNDFTNAEVKTSQFIPMVRLQSMTEYLPLGINRWPLYTHFLACPHIAKCNLHCSPQQMSN